MKRARISILLILGVTAAMAAPSKKVSKSKTDVPYVMAEEPKIVTPDTPQLKAANFEKEMDEAKKRGKREVASDLSGSIKKDFADYRDRFLNLKDTPRSSAGANELDQILYELENGKFKTAAPASDDLKFFAAQVAPLRSFRGFFHKVRTLARNYPIIQSYLVTMAKQMATNVDVFLTNYNGDSSSEHMKVLFRYISEPYNYDVTRKEEVELKYTPENLKLYGMFAFASEADIQNWLMADVYPRIQNSIGKLKAINLAKTKIVWDNKIFAGNDSYEDNVDRYRAVGQAERNSIISNFNGNLASILVFCSYSNRDLLQLVREMGFLYGVEEMDRYNPAEIIADYKAGGRDVFLKGASALERTDKITGFIKNQKDDKNDKINGKIKLFSILPVGFERMKLAYGKTLEANIYANLAWAEIRVRENNVDFALDGALFRPFVNVTNKSLEKMSASIRGSLTKEQQDLAVIGKLNLASKDLDDHFLPIRHAVSGDIVHANVVKFFFAPPSTLTSFLPLFPTQERSKDNIQMESDVRAPSGKNLMYRNYFHGIAKNWNTTAFNEYFKVDSRPRNLEKSDDVKKVLRVTSQSWGGLMIGVPLSNIML